jgi:hypothetical protein
MLVLKRGPSLKRSVQHTRALAAIGPSTLGTRSLRGSRPFRRWEAVRPQSLNIGAVKYGTDRIRPIREQHRHHGLKRAACWCAAVTRVTQNTGNMERIMRPRETYAATRPGRFRACPCRADAHPLRPQGYRIWLIACKRKALSQPARLILRRIEA